MNNWLAGGTRIDAVVANDDEMANGAIIALQRAGIDPKPKCIGGVDGTDDAHRILVGPGDRFDTIGQIRALLAGDYRGPLSFEPFAESVQPLSDQAGALRASMAYVRQGLARAA